MGEVDMKAYYLSKASDKELMDELVHRRAGGRSCVVLLCNDGDFKIEASGDWIQIRGMLETELDRVRRRMV